MNKGMWYAVGAYGLWGLSPVYWRLLHGIPASQLICHRVLWSCLILGIVIAASRQGRDFRAAVFTPRILGIYSIAAVLVSINWLAYVWAVNSGFIVQTSLGYFINPLINVLLGVVFLRERLRRWQWVAVGIALAGVLYLTLAHGSLPWISLTLALSFGLYGLVKKVAPLGPVPGLTLETGLLFPAALFYVLYVEHLGHGAFLHESPAKNVLIIGAGLVTTIPLLLFAAAARRIPLSLMGILQYINPTLQLLLGVLVYREPFTFHQFTAFGIVWIALILFGIEGFVHFSSENGRAKK